MTEQAPIPRRVHLVGIGGMHMSAIARILLARGHEVSGSDQRRTPLVDAIEALGARVSIGHAGENVGDAEMVVTTSAAGADNPELEYALERRIPLVKRAEMVARLMEGRQAVCIAGSHGKSTTSGLVAYLLRACGRDPTYLIGAEVAALGTNAAPGNGPHVVVEADEYDRAFLSYRPKVALVLNVEADHLDYYKTVEAMTEAFQGFVSNAVAGGTVFLCADSTGAMALQPFVPKGVAVETYSMRHDMRLPSRRSPKAGWYARLAPDATNDGGKTQAFHVLRYGEDLGEFRTALAGVHNILNALGAIGVCLTLGVTQDEVRSALPEYTGVRRRFEVIGEADGVLVMDDYAHHPTEVEAIAAAAKRRFAGRRVVALFQPHTYARTRYLLDGFRTCFRAFDRLYILETYAAREAIAEGMTGEQLVGEVVGPKPVGYAPDFESAADMLAEDLKPGDVFFTVGAGDVDAVGPMVLERLRQREGAPGRRA